MTHPEEQEVIIGAENGKTIEERKNRKHPERKQDTTREKNRTKEN